MKEEPLRPQLGEHAEALIGDVLDKREQSIIHDVLDRLAQPEPLDPQYAVQQWQAVAEARRLRSTLLARSRRERARLHSQPRED